MTFALWQDMAKGCMKPAPVELSSTTGGTGSGKSNFEKSNVFLAKSLGVESRFGAKRERGSTSFCVFA